MLYNIEAMAKINNYFKDRYDDDQAQFREKINRHRRFILYRILIAVVLVVAAGIKRQEKRRCEEFRLSLPGSR